MAEKFITTLYRYTLSNCKGTQIFSFDMNERLIGGFPFEIQNGHIVYHVYDIDESLLNNSSVIWWDKKIIENESIITKILPEKSEKINWKSRNRGGGGKRVRHKNFDKSAAKLYYKKTERPETLKKSNKSTSKTIIEPPMGIMGIIKKEDSDETKIE
jgi:hypothetical protein